MGGREDVLFEIEGILNGLLVKPPPPTPPPNSIAGHMYRHCEHVHTQILDICERMHPRTCRGAHVQKKTSRATDVCMHAYIQCMHASVCQSIFFLTPATSCNTSLSGSLSPPIRICALVIHGGLCQKVELS